MPSSSQASVDSPSTPTRRGPGRPRLLEPSPEFVARREEIVSTAAEVFHEKGYDAGTLDDVAEALDLRRASLYYYVKSKANLLYMVFMRTLDIGLAKVDEYSSICDPGERLEALIRHQVRMVASEPSSFCVFFDSRSRLDEKYKAEIRERERRYERVYASAVEAAVEARLIAELDSRYATHAILGMINWTYKWFRPSRDTIEALEDTCVALILGRPDASIDLPMSRGG